MQAVGFPKQPLYAVALHGLAQLCADRQAEPVAAQLVFAAVQHQMPARGRCAAVVQPPEFMVFL